MCLNYEHAMDRLHLLQHISRETGQDRGASFARVDADSLDNTDSKGRRMFHQVI